MGYLRPHQIDEIANEKRVLERTLNTRAVQDTANINAHLRRIDKELATQAPPDTTGEDRDRMTRECKEIEGRLVPLMPSAEEMRKNPPGVVGRHNKYDRASKDRTYFEEGDIFRWKDNQLALHKGDNDPDIANFERMRPFHNMGSMLGAQIEGQPYFGTHPSEAYKEGHDRTFGLPAEESEIEAPPRERKPAKRSKKKATRKRGPNKKPPKLTALACGKMMGPSGRHFHVKHCIPCQEAAQE